MNPYPWSSDFGRPRTLRPANPAAGSDFTITVETNSIWLPLSLEFTLVCGAGVANRQIQIIFADPTGEFARIVSANVHVAGSTSSHVLGMNHGYDPGGLNGFFFYPMPQRYFMIETDSISSSTVVLQAADQISNIRLRVLEWLHFSL